MLTEAFVTVAWCICGALTAHQAQVSGWRWCAFTLAGPLVWFIDTPYRRGRWRCRAVIQAHGLATAWRTLRQMRHVRPSRYQRGIDDELLAQLAQHQRGPAKAARQWWKGAKWMSATVMDLPSELREFAVRQLVRDGIFVGYSSDEFDNGATDALTILRKVYPL